MAETSPSTTSTTTSATDSASSPPLTKGSRITGEQRGALGATFAKRYAAGESIRSIAADSGRSYGFVHGVLKESGADLRGRGGATRGVDQQPEATPGPTAGTAKKAKKTKKTAKSKSEGKSADKKPGKKGSKKG